MEKNLPHLIVADFEKGEFTGTGGRGGGKVSPVRIRNEHSTFLKQQLEQAWADSGSNEQ